MTTTLKYFEIPYTEYKGIVKQVYRPNDLTKEVDIYANNNNGFMERFNGKN